MFFLSIKQRFLCLKTLVRYLAGVFLLLLSTGLLAEDSSNSCFIPQNATVQTAFVKRVIDGDSVELVDGRSVRLIGINAPERNASLHQGVKRNRPEPYYLEAKKALKDYLKNRKVKLISGIRSQDRYGRHLLYLYSFEGVFIPGELIRQGLGFRIAFSPDTTHQSCLKKLEKAARTTSKGVWATDYWQTSSSAVSGAGFQLLRGRVSAVNESRYSWWVDMDDKVTLKISKKELNRSQVNGFKGQILTARGWLIDRRQSSTVLQKKYKPWLMHITDISNIDVTSRLDE